MRKKKSTTNTTFKTPLLNDCTNHLAFQLQEGRTEKAHLQNNDNSYYEAPLADVVTYEFVRGYN